MLSCSFISGYLRDHDTTREVFSISKASLIMVVGFMIYDCVRERRVETGKNGVWSVRGGFTFFFLLMLIKIFPVTTHDDLVVPQILLDPC